MAIFDHRYNKIKKKWGRVCFYNIPRCFIVSTAAPIMAITATAIATYVTVPEEPTSSVSVTSCVTVEVCVTASAVTVLVTDDVAVVVVTAVVTFVTA